MTDRTGSDRYIMRISRMTVDKLGVRLYDRVSAVVAELVANAYDADAENVVVRVPLATLLARKNLETGEVEGYGHTIEVVDDGHGMTPTEANGHFLRVGKDRRADPTQGNRSRRKRRSVMGRKGIGKLAPFGICKRIEVLSAGGEETANGYAVTHFVMPYDRILLDEDTPVPMEVGDQDQTYRPKPGTTVRLIDFLPKRVPNQETFHRQMAHRFGLRQSDFNVSVEDTRNPKENPPFEIGSLEIPLMEGTRVNVSEERDFFDENPQLASEFSEGWAVDLVCDEVRIADRDKDTAYRYWRDTKHRVERISWTDFLARAVRANETFLAA